MAKSTKEILEKYSRKLDSSINSFDNKKEYSKTYSQFKKELTPELSSYEKWCKSLGRIIKIKPSEKDSKKIQKYLNIAHLDSTPSEAITLSVLALLGTFFLGLLISLAVFLITENIPVLMFFLFLIASLFLFYYIYKMPERIANKWRLKASSQMVPAILYIVIYMKHTSNLERAIQFTSEQLEPPLALDFKKIIWDVETSKFSTIKQSLDNYLETWRETNVEFIESFHLIESSLYEPSESRRITILEKALSIMLDGIYEKMLKYSHNVRGPLTNLYMLGIVLPTLGLALLPLASTLLQGLIKWYHVFVLFNLIVPFFVYYLTSEILLKRPGGYGETELLELNPDYKEYKSKKPYFLASFVLIIFLIIGLIPFLFQLGIFNFQDFTMQDLGLGFLGNELKAFNFINHQGSTVGPFGPIALLFSLFIPLGVALFFSIAYSMKTKKIIKSREKSKDLEKEFNSALFQLGNRLGEGIPAEIAFSKVAESTKGTKTAEFFKLVNTNIQNLGMSIQKAVFDKKRGAIIFFPSTLIATSMKILIESSKKGLKVAARSLISISEYVKNIWKINERLRDLLAEVSSDMKSNMTFLAPLLAGVIIGLTAMITLILSKLQIIFELGEAEAIGGFSLSTITSLFNVQTMIPPYYLQVSIGIYLIEIVFILTATLITVDAGEDKLRQTYQTGKNLAFSLILYTIVALVSITFLSILAGVALSGLG